MCNASAKSIKHCSLRYYNSNTIIVFILFFFILHNSPNNFTTRATMKWCTVFLMSGLRKTARIYFTQQLNVWTPSEFFLAQLSVEQMFCWAKYRDKYDVGPRAMMRAHSISHLSFFFFYLHIYQPFWFHAVSENRQT